MWPVGKFPLLRDEARDRTIPESTIIIEYLEQHYPGRTKLIPADADLARQTRFHDRFYDLHLHDAMQKVVGDRLRPAGSKDPFGVEQAKARIATAYGMIDREMATKKWAMGDLFTMADCAAAPALFYANLAVPFGDAHKNVAAYFGRLMERPSFARAVNEAKPYFHMFPK
jgi:glutathione S-transferase